MAYTQQDLDNLKLAIATGEKTVQFADRSVTYRSLTELQAAAEMVAAELNPKRSKQFLGFATKGY